MLIATHICSLAFFFDHVAAFNFAFNRVSDFIEFFSYINIPTNLGVFVFRLREHPDKAIIACYYPLMLIATHICSLAYSFDHVAAFNFAFNHVFHFIELFSCFSIWTN